MPRNQVRSGPIKIDGAPSRGSRLEARRLMVTNRHQDWFRIENKEDEPDYADVYIYDEIGFWGTEAAVFVKQLSQIDKNRINLHLNTPGGDVWDGVAIYNSLRSHPASIDVFVDGIAASAGSFIAQAGDRIVMNLGSQMMIHDASGICFGNAVDMRDTADILDKVSNSISEIYAMRTGDTSQYWRDVMREEAWYTAQEAVEAGLADEVSETGEKAEVSDRWDLSVFNYNGRENAPSPKVVRQLVLNRAMKEASVSPKNQADPEPTPDPTPEPEPTPEPTLEPEPAPEPTLESEPEPEPEPQPQNRAGVSFMINGVRTSDITAVQAHINTLEGAAKEQKALNRKSFIKGLCDSNKILASQVDQYEAFVLGTDDEPGLTDKQYEKWCASWDAAPGLGVLAKNVTGGNGGSPENHEEDEIDIAREIVRQNMRSNMPKAQLEQTSSYLKLKAANALDTL